MAKILIIEDEAILREEILDWLDLEGYDGIGAGDGLAGLEMARSEKPDLIISDITMPKLDGFGVLLELNSDPLTAGIPFIFVTARAAHDDMRHGMNLGADDYITKPFTRLELLYAIETRLKKKFTQIQDYEAEIAYWQQAYEQEQNQRMLKGRIVGMFSHDFRNPLSLIQSSASLLINYYDRIDQERQLQKLKQITGSVQLLMQMMDDMLLLAQMENVDYTPQAEATNMNKFVRQIISEFVDLYHETHEFTVEGEIRNDLQVDPKLLRQILSNLLSNAVKYSPDSRGIIVRLEESEHLVKLYVQDSGIGIPKEYLHSLFQPFLRADNAKSTKGTGLGLAIVKQAVDHCNGEIHVDSELNRGTSVCVHLPRIQ